MIEPCRGCRPSSCWRGGPTTVVRIGSRCWITNDSGLLVSCCTGPDTVSRQVSRNGLLTVISSRGKSTTTKSTDALGTVGSVACDIGGDIGIVPARPTLGVNGTGDCTLPDTGGVCGRYGGCGERGLGGVLLPPRDPLFCMCNGRADAGAVGFINGIRRDNI